MVVVRVRKGRRYALNCNISPNLSFFTSFFFGVLKHLRRYLRREPSLHRKYSSHSTEKAFLSGERLVIPRVSLVGTMLEFRYGLVWRVGGIQYESAARESRSSSKMPQGNHSGMECDHARMAKSACCRSHPQPSQFLETGVWHCMSSIDWVPQSIVARSDSDMHQRH